MSEQQKSDITTDTKGYNIAVSIIGLYQKNEQGKPIIHPAVVDMCREIASFKENIDETVLSAIWEYAHQLQQEGKISENDFLKVRSVVKPLIAFESNKPEITKFLGSVADEIQLYTGTENPEANGMLHQIRSLGDTVDFKSMEDLDYQLAPLNLPDIVVKSTVEAVNSVKSSIIGGYQDCFADQIDCCANLDGALKGGISYMGYLGLTPDKFDKDTLLAFYASLNYSAEKYHLSYQDIKNVNEGIIGYVHNNLEFTPIKTETAPLLEVIIDKETQKDAAKWATYNTEQRAAAVKKARNKLSSALSHTEELGIGSSPYDTKRLLNMNYERYSLNYNLKDMERVYKTDFLTKQITKYFENPTLFMDNLAVENPLEKAVAEKYGWAFAKDGKIDKEFIKLNNLGHSTGIRHRTRFSPNRIAKNFNKDFIFTDKDITDLLSQSNFDTLSHKDKITGLTPLLNNIGRASLRNKDKAFAQFDHKTYTQARQTVSDITQYLCHSKYYRNIYQNWQKATTFKEREYENEAVNAHNLQLISTQSPVSLAEVSKAKETMNPEEYKRFIQTAALKQNETNPFINTIISAYGKNKPCLFLFSDEKDDIAAYYSRNLDCIVVNDQKNLGKRELLKITDTLFHEYTHFIRQVEQDKNIYNQLPIMAHSVAGIDAYRGSPTEIEAYFIGNSVASGIKELMKKENQAANSQPSDKNKKLTLDRLQTLRGTKPAVVTPVSAKADTTPVHNTAPNHTDYFNQKAPVPINLLNSVISSTAKK